MLLEKQSFKHYTCVIFGRSLEMLKSIFVAVVTLSLVSVLGCSDISELIQPSPPEGPDIVRRAELGEEWQMDQMRVHVVAGDESLILLKLADGDEVDGYFYLEKGEDIDFRITGDSLIYESGGSTEITSDRFSFVADQTQGNTYTLTFRNPADDDEAQEDATVFLEVIYPVNGSLFVPLATK